MQKRKDQVMQPVTMAILIAIVILSELPSFSALINSSSPPVISRKVVSPSEAETMGNTDKHLPSNHVNIPVWGDVYPNGFYHVSIAIGDPPKAYNLDIDSGSDLTWLPEGLYESQSMRYKQSYYGIEYSDGTISEGRLVTDNFTLQLRGGNLISHRLVIGRSAHYSSTGTSSSSTSHGMLGLGKGENCILSQLQEQGLFANIFGHCLSSDPEVSGFMFIGKDFDYLRCLTWVPMSTHVSHVCSYSLKMAQVVYGDEKLLGMNQVFVLDSGTSYTYFVDPLYQELLAKVTKTPLQKAPRDADYHHCWKCTNSFNSISDIRRYFPTLKLKFGEGQVLEIPPDNYFIIREKRDACLGIFNGRDKKLSFNLIGAISMQNVMVVYDNERQQIGWARVAGCSKPPVEIYCKPQVEIYSETPLGELSPSNMGETSSVDHSATNLISLTNLSPGTFFLTIFFAIVIIKAI